MKRNQILTAVLFNAIAPLLTPGAYAAPQATAEPSRTFGKVPLSFEANVGQTDPQVRFLTRGSGYTAFFTSRETVVKLTKKTSNKTGPNTSESLSEGVRPDERVEENVMTAVVRVKLVNMNPDARLEASGPIPARITYLSGTSESKPQQPPSFERIAYRGAWPGVTMVYHSNQRQLEYDFDVSPGAQLSTIRLAFEGVDGMRIDRNGDLVLITAAGEMRQPAPVIYQEIDGKKVNISGGYLITGPCEIGFDVGNHDKSKPVVIDPTLVFADFWGGSGQDYAQAVAIDPRTGLTYVAGYTSSPDFPVTLSGDAPGGANAFVSAISADGTSLVFSTYIGGSFDDQATGIALDSAGKIYITGWTQSSDFPDVGFTRYSCGIVCRPPYSQPTQIPVDLFIVELDSTGKVLFSERFGGSSDDYANAIAVDNYGLVYVTGRTYSSDFPVVTHFVDPVTGMTTDTHLSTNLNGRSDAFLFVTNIQPGKGPTIISSSLLGGAGDESAKSIAVINPSYNQPPCGDCGTYVYTQVFIGGWTSSYNFPTTSGASQRGYQGGNADGFVVRIDVSHTNSFAVQFEHNDYSLGYATYVGGENEDVVYGIAVDSTGIAHATGYTRSLYFPVTYNAFQRYFGGGTSDAFVVKLGTKGAFQYATYFGGSGDDYGRAIVVDNYGRAIFVGYTDSYDLPVTYQAFQFGNAGGWDAFLAELTDDGSYLPYSSYFGSWNDEFANAMARDGYGNVFVAGSTNSTNGGNNAVLLFKLNMN